MPRGQRVLDHEIASMVDTDKNDMEWAATLTTGSNYKLWWICQCGQSFERVIKRVIRGDQTVCMDCSQIKKAKSLRRYAIDSAGSFAHHRPELAKDWHQDNKLDPSEFALHDSQEVMWKCHKCNHEWTASLRKRTVNPSCPGCPPEWSIGDTVFRDHIDPNQSGYKRILLMGVYSKNKVYWVCTSCRSSFERAIRHVNDQSGILCRSCLNLDSGSLADNRPDLVDEWHGDNELKPDEVTHFSWKIIKWKCKSCNHIWETSVANRTNRNSGCPNCWKRSGPTSRTEIDLRDSTSICLDESLNPNTYIDVDINDARRHVVADMTTDDFIAVEYDSRYWHQGREGRDRERLLIMEKAGYSVISVREKGLQLLTETDLVYDPRRETIADLAQRVADQIQSIRSARA